MLTLWIICSVIMPLGIHHQLLPTDQQFISAVPRSFCGNCYRRFTFHIGVFSYRPCVQTLEMLEKKERFLQKKCSAEIEKAKDYTKSKNKNGKECCFRANTSAILMFCYNLTITRHS
jgi:hypothetical protein